MKNFKDGKGNDKIKTRKNRNSELDNLLYTFFLPYRKDPEFMSEDREFNIDAELAADFEAKLA